MPRVLIVGSGPVGLTLAMDLAWRGIDVIVAERRPPNDPPNVKCGQIGARSMEVFRRLGVAEKLRGIGLPADYPHDVVYRTSFLGRELSRIKIPSRAERYTSKDGPPSVTSPVAYTILEGLSTGRNYQWNLDFTKRLGNNLEISLQYEGRKAGDQGVINTGRASLRALL